MKISYRTHPILQVIEKEINANGKHVLDRVKSQMPQSEFRSMQRTFNLFDEAKENVIVLSKPFQEAIKLSFYKLQKEEYYEETYGCCGVLIQGNWTFVYKIIDKYNLYVLKFYSSQLFAMLYCTNGESEWYLTPEFSSGIPEEKAAQFIVNQLITALIFIKYADIETRHLPAGQKVKGIDCKYINETKTNIKYINISWYTNLIKSDGFNVRGHFRLQPKKDEKGEWTKELIWINEFQKTGYTAPARKLKENPL